MSPHSPLTLPVLNFARGTHAPAPLHWELLEARPVPKLPPLAQHRAGGLVALNTGGCPAPRLAACWAGTQEQLSHPRADERPGMAASSGSVTQARPSGYLGNACPLTGSLCCLTLLLPTLSCLAGSPLSQHRPPRPPHVWGKNSNDSRREPGATFTPSLSRFSPPPCH